MLRKAHAWWVESFGQPTFLGYLAVVRILVGYHFVDVAVGKVARGYWSGENLHRQLAGVVDDPIVWHRAFIEGVVLPHPVFFSYLVAFGELAIGISLITGCLVRMASSFGAFHNLNIYLAVAIPAGGAGVGLNRIFIFLHLIFVMTSAGRALGVDGFLKKKFPRCWLF